MRATIRPMDSILTRAHRVTVSMITKGVLWSKYCLSGSGVYSITTKLTFLCMHF